MVTAPWRRLLVCASLCFTVVLLGGGCRTSSGWRAPWSGWGWSGASSPSATALNISKPNKPSTQGPAPSNTNSLVGTGGGASGVTTASATGPAARTVSTAGPVTTYPATAHADAHPSRAAGNLQPEAGEGEVAPAGGYQVGPYGMQGQSQNPSGYANSPRNSLPANAEGGNGGAEDYRTAEQPAGPRGSAAAGVYAPSAENPAANQPGSVYGEAAEPATATESSIYGPANETSPADDSGAATGPYSGAEGPAGSAAPRTYGPPNTVAPGARPSTSPPAASGSARAPLPQSLSTAGGYRPGSTGARNAGFEQPQQAESPQENQPGGIFR